MVSPGARCQGPEPPARALRFALISSQKDVFGQGLQDRQVSCFSGFGVGEANMVETGEQSKIIEKMDN